MRAPAATSRRNARWQPEALKRGARCPRPSDFPTDLTHRPALTSGRMDLRFRIPRALFSSTRWRTRLVLWSAAARTGLAAVGFAALSNLALLAFDRLTAAHHWIALLLTPAIGMGVVWATRRYFAGAQGSGIPQAIAATRALQTGHAPQGLLSLRIAAGKVGLGALALLGGFSAGREGPSVQIGASIMHFAHRYLPHARSLRPSDLALAGGAAGIAAAFNTPLAGITFAVEELGRRLEARTSGVLLSTIIIAGLTAIAVEGNYRYFGQLVVGAVGFNLLWAVLVGGVVSGISFYGNCLGLPNIGGETVFDKVYQGNPLVNAMCVGVARSDGLLAAVARGVAYLQATQAEHGLWNEARFTATGFPRVFYLRYARADDTTLRTGDREVRVPGVATIVARVMGDGLPIGTVGGSYGAQQVRQSVPRLMGKGLDSVAPDASRSTPYDNDEEDYLGLPGQEPIVVQLLPLTGEHMERTAAEKAAYGWDYIYEPDAKAVVDELLVRYVEALVYQAVAENMASEQSARMVAMKAASDNAKNVINELQLTYNKARQAAITKELSEIVGGAAAIS